MSKIDRLGVGMVLLLASASAQAVAPPASLPGVPAPLPGSESPAQAVRAAWPSMTPQQKRELRARYASWQALPESERQRIRAAASRLAALPDSERDSVRARFAGMDQMHRDGWLLGPQLGAAYARLHPLLGYLPAGQREPMLALLRQMDAASVEQLSLISLRTPPQDRAALRDELLAVPAAQRTAWLREKVGH